MNEDISIIETARRYLDSTGGNSWEAVVNRYIDWNGNNNPVSAINENECEADYFRRLLKCSERAKEAIKTHETWKRRHMNGLRERDCMQRILIVLGELLKSDFLRYDWFDTGFPKEDREQAIKELREQGFEELLQTEGADWKFALLGHLRKQQEPRIVIEEHNAGFYISEMHDKLSEEAVEAFCRFVTFTRLAYQEIDRLKKENPNLKAQHDYWLNKVNEQQPEENNETGMGAARLSKLDEIIGILQKGNWKQPATAENITLLLNAVFGKDTSLLDDSDADECEKMWALVEGGVGDRMVIMPANLAGYFAEENLLAGSPKEISNALFGNGNQANNINKGNSKRCSTAFKVIIPFLKKYIDKIIRQI